MQAIDGFYIANNAIVVGDIALSPGVNIWYACVVRGDLARITFGARVNLQDGCIVHTDGGCPQHIEEGVVVGHAAVLHGSRIGAGSLIGIGARLLSGSEIGEECLIAAGSVVPEGRRIPARSVALGIPAKVVRAITDDEMANTRRINASYLDLAARHARHEFHRYNR